jgi:hypothetical protein
MKKIIPFITLILILWLSSFLLSPGPIRLPKSTHFHFRMQLSVNGVAQNFADNDFQQGYSKDQCDGRLASEPIHFHDTKDQLVHIHWDNITGGQVLKYYGLNQINSQSGSLGMRFDKLGIPRYVPIHGNALDKPAARSKLYIYTGEKDQWVKRDNDRFIYDDLETFFGKTFYPEESLFDRYIAGKAYAHNDAGDIDMDVNAAVSDSELKEINTLVGNVVIFVQTTEPTMSDVQAKFDNLIELTPSTCGG